jgi:hypothetical protein
VKKCKGQPGSPDYKCQETHFTCYDGRNGSAGRDGNIDILLS